ncbi:major facilitator superfamily domain-containing protein [Lipomyces starkeyi]
MFMSNIWDCFTMPPVQGHYVSKIDFFFCYSLATYIVKALIKITSLMLSYLECRLMFKSIMWGILIMCIAAANSVTTIYGIRFVSGYFESPTFPSFSLILGSWYTPGELGKRISLFELIYNGRALSMNGTRGIPAWRWMFIIDGVITIPIGIIGFPTSSRAMWLTPWERERLRRLFLGPTLWTSSIPYSANWWLNYTGYFNLWLKSLTNPKFTTDQLNTIPTAGSALAVISAYVWPTISDKTLARWQFGLPMGVLMFAQLIPNCVSGQSLLIAWIQESFQDDTELRSMITGFGNVINYAYAWLPLVCYPTYMAPHYNAGYQTSAGLYYIKWYHKRNNMVLNNFGLPEKWDQISNENSAGAVIMQKIVKIDVV